MKVLKKKKFTKDDELDIHTDNIIHTETSDLGGYITVWYYEVNHEGES